MKLLFTAPTVLSFFARAVIPLTFATLGAIVFMAQNEGDFAKAASNGIWLLGSAGVCVGWAIESSLSTHYRLRYLRDMERLTGIESLTDEERAAIVMLSNRLKEFSEDE